MWYSAYSVVVRSDMPKTKHNRLSLVCILIGTLLLVTASGYLLWGQINSRIAKTDNREIVAQVEKLIPPARDAFPEERGNNGMPALSVSGVDVAAILEIPSFDCKLPLRTSYDKDAVKKMPCRYSGSIYDTSLVIVTTDRTGQMDFVDEIGTDCRLYLTDMEGERYHYRVQAIKHTEAPSDTRFIDTYDLVIYIRTEFDGKYTVLCANAQAVS